MDAREEMKDEPTPRSVTFSYLQSYIDVSDRALVRLSGSGSLDFLQRISTNDLKDLKPGVARPTLLTNEKGRIVDLVNVGMLDRGEIFLAGNSTRPAEIVAWLEKFVIMEDIIVKDVTQAYKQILIMTSEQLITDDIEKCVAPSRLLVIDEGDSTWGKRLLLDADGSSKLVEALRKSGNRLLRKVEYDEFRIREGIPAYPQELALQFNPLELGLWSFVSWTKGCYIGQEVIARLDTYKKVQKSLARMNLAGLPPTLPYPIHNDAGECGTITSVTKNEERTEILGLGLIRTQYLEKPGELWFLDDAKKYPIEVKSVVRW